MRAALLLSASISVAACAGGPAKTPATDALVAKLPIGVKTTTLGNGLKVVVQEDHRLPTVTVNVVYHVGSSGDPPGRTGFAHLFEHLMFEGSAHVPRGAFDAWLLRAGGTHNATTDYDTTRYYETLPSAQLDLAL
jgi:zinc protease